MKDEWYARTGHRGKFSWKTIGALSPARQIWAETAIPERAFDRSADLARRHGAKLGIRTLDSLHVACALELKAERFWTFDERQAKLARAEGLKTTEQTGLPHVPRRAGLSDNDS